MILSFNDPQMSIIYFLELSASKNAVQIVVWCISVKTVVVCSFICLSKSQGALNFKNETAPYFYMKLIFSGRWPSWLSTLLVLRIVCYVSVVHMMYLIPGSLNVNWKCCQILALIFAQPKMSKYGSKMNNSFYVD